MPLPIKFNPNVSSALNDRELLKKMKAAKKTVPKSNNIMDIIEVIRQDVEKNLGKFRDQYQVITDIETFKKYIQKANAHGKIAIDTETLGLNPLVDGIVGLCLYFPGEPATYVPINHTNYISDVRLDDQLTIEEVRAVLCDLTADIIYHNAQFDIRVIKNQVGIRLSVYWDTLIAGQLYDENEPHGLKVLHYKYIEKPKAELAGQTLSEDDTEKTFSDLFGKIQFKYVPIEYAYLYAAHDAIDTYELYEFQLEYFKTEPDLMKLLTEVEIPMVDVIVDLEDTGVAVDTEYLQELHDKYSADVTKAYNKCMDIVNEKEFMDKIKKYNAIHSDKPIVLPLMISSPTQLRILFYDVLKCKIPASLSGKKEGSTDVDVMNAWASQYPIAKAILEYRAATKIISTYVDNIPGITHTDGRVHTHFKSMGAKTGRMSSSDPLNLQNIPSHNEDIRKMFVGQTTYRDVGIREDHARIFDRCEEIQLADESWQWVENIKVGDTLITGDVVKAVKVKEFKVLIGVSEDAFDVISARTRRIIQGADYSAQEPRVLTQLCEDEGMLKAYKEGKDLYVEIASISFGRPYKKCLEHFPKNCPMKKNADGKWEYAKLKNGLDDGKEKFEDLDYSNINPEDYDYDKLSDGETDVFKEGKEYRSQAKKILLGIMYGRGENSIAEQLGCSPDEARAIKQNVYDSFPRIKVFERESAFMVKSKGYVTTLWGRKRRLPDYNLPTYEFHYVDENDNIITTQEVPQSIQDQYKTKLCNMFWRDKANFIKKLHDEERILVVDNNKKIAAAGRQIINSRVQGSAADMSKLALVKIRNDKELSDRGVKAIIPVHDEILIETPLRYAKYVKKRFAYDMETAAQPKLTIPVSCDVVSSERWYGDELDVDEVLKGLDE